MHYDRRLDADIAFQSMSINAVKGIEIGNGFLCAEQFGSQVHDEIILMEKVFHEKQIMLVELKEVFQLDYQ